MRKCSNKLQQCLKREQQLLDKEDTCMLEKVIREKRTDEHRQPSKQDYYMVGSSILREVRHDNILNATVKCIRGGKISDVRENIKSLEIEPKCTVTQIGGNDLASSDTSVETVTAEYAVLLSDIKTKFPESEVVVSGLPPRFHVENIREKVKDFNNNSKKWCAANNMKYIDNEPMFELRNGEIDTSVYVTTGETPNVHLTRRGTIRILENLKKEMPNLKLNNDLNTRAMIESHSEERQTRPSFSQVVRYGKHQLII